MSKQGANLTMEQEAVMNQLYKKFITASHIMHKHKVLDAYGHLSVRHPFKPDVFIMSQHVAPGTLASRDDLIEYWIKDASPVDTNTKPGYAERCIHSEILKAFPEINCAVHSHTEAVTPYTFNGVPLRSCTHMGGFIGGDAAPVWDIQTAYQQGDKHNMLVSSTRLGGSLAKAFDSKQSGKADEYVVLMRGHGLTVVAEKIEDVVMRCIYTLNNAAMQTTALITRSAYLATASQEEASQMRPMQYLSPTEAYDAMQMNMGHAMRPWKLWCREVESDPLYVNHG